MNDNGTGQDLGATGQSTSRCLILRLRQFVAWGLLTLCSGAAGMIVDVAQAGEVAATSAAASTSGAGGAGNSAATSAALLSSAAQKAPAIPPVPLADVPAMATPAAIAGSEDATGKPPAPGKGQASAQAESTKKRKVAHGRRKTKEPVLADTPVMIQPEPPSLLDALFGNSQDLPPVAATADPAVTAATDALGADVSKQKGKGKGSKIAKNTILPSNATGQPLPDVDLFGSENAPFATGELGYPLMSPGNVDPLKAAIKRYADIVANGGWPTVSPLQMQVGTNNAAVAELRRRLKIEGDLKGDPSGFSGPSYFDQEVSDALKSFQSRYGLGETGDLMDSDRLKNGTRTVIALNVPAEARLAQLKANLARFQSKTIGKGRYVVVNIPGEQIEAVDGNRVVLRLNGVVGRPERPSPLLSSSIEEIKFNPLWTMPPTVVREDLIPKGQSLQAKGQDVLSKFGIDAYDGNGKKVDSSKINWSKATVDSYRFSQQPGKDNPLGFAKLDFASPESVYMHDTPSAKLFDKSYRAASSGCIRVEHMDKLVSWLLRETDGWSTGRVQSMKETGESKIVRLKHGVPLHWVYITAWATEDGTVHFRRDLYGKDQAFGVSKTASAY